MYTLLVVLVFLVMLVLSSFGLVCNVLSIVLPGACPCNALFMFRDIALSLTQTTVDVGPFVYCPLGSAHFNELPLDKKKARN